MKTASWSLKTAATVAPLDLAAAKRQCRIEDSVSDDDALLETCIAAAADYVKRDTGRPLTRETWQMSLPVFPRRWWLPMAAPLGAVSFVKYYDANNTLQTLSTSVYQVTAFSEPAEITLVDGQSWPSIYTRADAVQVEYTVGETDPAALRPGLVQAMLLLVGHWYANREDVVVGTSAFEVPVAAEALFAQHRVFFREPEWSW